MKIIAIFYSNYFRCSKYKQGFFAFAAFLIKLRFQYNNAILYMYFSYSIHKLWIY